MTEAEKMAEKFLLEIEGVDWVDWEYDGKQLGIIKDAIQQIGERTLEECEKASTFELAPHPRWSMKVGDAIRARRWWEEEA